MSFLLPLARKFNPIDLYEYRGHFFECFVSISIMVRMWMVWGRGRWQLPWPVALPCPALSCIYLGWDLRPGQPRVQTCHSVTKLRNLFATSCPNIVHSWSCSEIYEIDDIWNRDFTFIFIVFSFIERRKRFLLLDFAYFDRPVSPGQFLHPGLGQNPLKKITVGKANLFSVACSDNELLIIKTI